MNEDICLHCGTPVVRKTKRPVKFCRETHCRQEYWRLRNPERDLASKRAYWEKNAETLRAKGRAKYYATKDHQLALAKVRYQKTRLTLPWRIIFNSSKARAAAKKLPFDLTHDWIKARWTGRCELTDIPFVLTKRGEPKPFAASIDRKDPKRGYVQDNCRIILHAVNVFKGDDTDEVMFMVAEVLTKRRL